MVTDLRIKRGQLVYMFGIFVISSACGASFSDERPATLRPGMDAGGGAGQDDDGNPSGMEIARGSFSGANGYTVSGKAFLESDGAGNVSLVLDSDFVSQGGPALYVVLSSRSEIGVSLDPSTDVELGELERLTGMQRYTVGADDGQRWVWIWCKTFGVDFGGALLTEVP